MKPHDLPRCKNCVCKRWYMAMRKASKKWEAAHRKQRNKYFRDLRIRQKIAKNGAGVDTTAEITQKTPYLPLPKMSTKS